jgi:hypothetical protein
LRDDTDLSDAEAMRLIALCSFLALPLLVACSSSGGSSSSSGTSGSSGDTSSSSSSTSSGSTTTTKFSCSLNGDCYKCPSSQAVSDCADPQKGPSAAGCTSTDPSFCQ